MPYTSKPASILMADDDEDDRYMAKEALKEARNVNDFSFVEDSEELMDYLKDRGKYVSRKNEPQPGLGLLDLNMPKKNGHEALQEIKADPDLRKIPVIVLTTSKVEKDIIRTYGRGINSYITKPVTFVGLVEVMRSLSLYWFNIVQLPQ